MIDCDKVRHVAALARLTLPARATRMKLRSSLSSMGRTKVCRKSIA